MLILPNEEAPEEVALALGDGTTGCGGAILCNLGAGCLQDEPSGSSAWRAEPSERTRSAAATTARKIGTATVERTMLPANKRYDEMTK